MIDPTNIPLVADDELLARYIVNTGETRVDGTVRPQLFLPYRHVALSVNRHRDATLDETWEIGFQVAARRGKALLGRADIRASACRIEPLDVIPQPLLPHNPNHADVVGFPPRKDEQLSLAAKLAASVEGRWHVVPRDAGSGDA